VAADWKQRVPVLLVIPLLGLGASFVYSQHNTVVGALGLYIGKELHEASAAIVGTDGVVRSWDASNTLKNTTRPLKARLASGLIILVGPSLAACTLAPLTRPSAAVIGAALGGATVSAWMAGTLLVSHRERARLRAAIL
jgi:hypothetical protein